MVSLSYEKKRRQIAAQGEDLIYLQNSPYIGDAIDKYRTGNYGEDEYISDGVCRSCGGSISEGDRYYEVGGEIYCMNCEKEAECEILDEVRENYIYEM